MPGLQHSGADILRIDGREVPARRLLKPLYPSGFTKAQVIDYYDRVAPVLLPHLRERPVALKRFPNGLGGLVIWDKDAPRFTPSWVPTTPVWRRSHASQIHYIVIDDRPTLVWAASIAALEFHPFLHRRGHLDRPTLIVFDLDPGPPADLRDCIEVAFLIREQLARLKLRAWVKVSGSKGLQVYVPLNTPVTYGEAQPFARACAEWLAERHPDRIVAAMKKALRGGKVFIDWSQNADFKTTVGAYSLRAKSEQPYVSMPVTWEELRQAMKKGTAGALAWEPAAALARIAKVGDPFAPVLTTRQRLPVFAQPPRPSRAPRPRKAPAPTPS